MFQTKTELLTDLLRAGVIREGVEYRNASRDLEIAAEHVGIKLYGIGGKFVPELGGVVQTIVEAPLSDEDWDNITILGNVRFGA